VKTQAVFILRGDQTSGHDSLTVPESWRCRSCVDDMLLTSSRFRPLIFQRVRQLSSLYCGRVIRAFHLYHSRGRMMSKAHVWMCAGVGARFSDAILLCTLFCSRSIGLYILRALLRLRSRCSWGRACQTTLEAFQA